MWDLTFGPGGYFVSTVGRDEQVIREYIRYQEQEDRRIDQLQLDPFRGLKEPSGSVINRFERFTN